MKELTLSTLLAVFEEIFGTALFWALVVTALIVTLAFVYVLLRDRKLVGSRLLRAELTAPLGAIAAILFVLTITSSGLSDLGGPVDAIVMILIGALGAVGLTILAYVAQAVIEGRRQG
ncbi:DUF5368 domain-containing protein [Stappia sp.]|uniref:DUF5368 domain-containing protein n=1 Tax=Stappia sp. TaxID=1870903 RepID=UPI003D0A47A9